MKQHSPIEDLRIFSCALQHKEYPQVTYTEQAAFMASKVKKVSEAMYVSVEEIMSNSTSDRASFARKISQYIIFKGGVPQPQICIYFNRGRTRVFESIKDVEASIRIYRETRELVNVLLNQ